MRRSQELSGWRASLAGDHSEEESKSLLPLLLLPAWFLQDINMLQAGSGGISNKSVLCLLANKLHMSRSITKLSNYEGTCYYIKSAWVQREGEERGHISLKNIVRMWSKGGFFLFTHCHCFICRAWAENSQGFWFFLLERTDIFSFQSFYCLTAAGVMVTRALWSVTTKQEYRSHRGECWDQVAPPQLSGRWGRASDPGCGQARSQQLLLESEVIHHQVIGQVWEEGQWKICHREPKKGKKKERKKTGAAKIRSQKQHTRDKSVLTLQNGFHSCKNNAPQMSHVAQTGLHRWIFLVSLLKCWGMWWGKKQYKTGCMRSPLKSWYVYITASPHCWENE